MPIFDIFSKRQKHLRGEVPDTYQYHNIPQPLRVQIIHIWQDAIGRNMVANSPCFGVYSAVEKILCREYGVFRLPGNGNLDVFFLNSDDIDQLLDVIELVFRLIDSHVRDYPNEFSRYVSISADEAIKELNTRFKEHGVGYQYESGQLIRIDSEIIHAEVVKPLLQLLHDKSYQGANEEFLKAHKHYREGSYTECLNECLKAFESTMKEICAKRKWAYNQNDTAAKLIGICFTNKLIPDYLQSEFSAFQSLLASGVPTARNKLTGHGRGTQPINLPEHFASYILHMTATNILFLIQSEIALP